MRTLPALQAPKGLTPKATSLWLLYCLLAPDHPAWRFPLKGRYTKEWDASPGCHAKRPAQTGLHVYRHLVQERSSLHE